jgi:hypothetical protein
MPTSTNETSSTEPGIRTSITLDLPSVEDLKSQLEAKEAVIAQLQDEVKKLLRQAEFGNCSYSIGNKVMSPPCMM